MACMLNGTTSSRWRRRKLRAPVASLRLRGEADYGCRRVHLALIVNEGDGALLGRSPSRRYTKPDTWTSLGPRGISGFGVCCWGGHERSRHGWQDVQVSIEGNHVYVIFTFRQPGDAAGQNMVTIATQAICAHINLHSPVKPAYYFLEANHSGDKKASAQSSLCGRGRSVTADVVIPAMMVQEHLHTTPEIMAKFFTMGAIGGVMSGAMGIQCHFANGLAAIYLACGQDVASVAESAVGIARLEVTPEGALYASVTLPSLPVGTVGGGTGLPSQKACLDILGLAVLLDMPTRLRGSVRRGSRWPVNCRLPGHSRPESSPRLISAWREARDKPLPYRVRLWL